MLNRKNSPELKSIGEINFVEPKKYVISEGVDLFHMTEVMNETTRFDLYFEAGKIQGENGISSFVNGLLLSGTDKKNSVEIQNEINSMGAFYEAGVSMESAVVSVYCLREKAIDLLKVITESIRDVVFDEKEVREYLADKKQGHRIAMKKVSFLAQREFQKRLFNSDIRYNQVIDEEQYDQVKIEELKSFHKKNYLNGLRRVAVVGNFPEESIREMIELVKSFAASAKPDVAIELENEAGVFHVNKEDALQSAIRIGRTLFNKNHPDYLDFVTLNTLLGDYFGSRLMSNIREEKGYTYGIGSAVAEFSKTGYFLVATEVGKDVREPAIEEIKKELEDLQYNLVPEHELSLVRNYMLGQLLKSADGPYAMMDLFLSAEINDCTLEFYNEAIAAVDNVTPERIQELAKKYLNWDQMTIISAG